MTRNCTDTGCRGDCDTCNRAPVENRPLPRQFLSDEQTLEASMMRVRNGSSTAEDAQRLMCALQSALAEKAMRREELRPACAC